MDTLSPDERSARMALIRGKNTKPELLLRQALVRAGLTGYRLHDPRIPGKPDVAFTRWKVAVFVDGAWWHGRPDRFHPERSNDFWREKIEGNVARDRRVDAQLADAGWVVVRIWEDQVGRYPAECVRRVEEALRGRGRLVSNQGRPEHRRSADAEQ